ncbi:drug resistance transporter, EmrB/QacA subfamily [Pedococcus cremeus]|uniref:Drug resistance transporter, EmrB/QacA subfamily n=1 Tax=Pedococcus cremeus TaxID=587636 RepID=A0A1H9XR86_9MICO|nr:MDR family MFS transporter [Pedococcus cremeus]SES48549.1 drug resistance transporter, EmrB/QacA subfamily [Pedococcus cremeus]
MATAAVRPEGPLTHKQIVTILIGLMMGMFLAALDQTIVATAIRTIADDLKGLDQQAWATTAYLITSTIVTPLYGKLGDIYGRKKLFIFAISIFVVGSVLCTLAQTMPQLAAYRAVQGIGAGGLFSLALAIIGDIVPPRERAKYQGYFLAVFGTSSVLGPVIGGFFAGQDQIFGIDGWRWVFLVNVPIGIAALAVVSKTLHLHHTRLDHRIDWWGAVALSVSLVPLLLVAEQGRQWGWGSTSALICYGIGIIGAAAFFAVERAMGEEALLPLALFRIRTVGVASGASVLIGIAMFGGLACLPLYLQIVKGASPTEAGLLLLPMTLGIMSGSISSGQIISRTGRYRTFPVVGSGLLAVALFVFHYVHEDTPLWQTMIVMFFFGIGLGFNFQPLTLAVQNAVPPQQIGVATSSATFTRQIGGTLGTAVFLSILFTTVPDKIAAALQKIAPTPAFQEALRDPKNAEFAKQLQAQKAGGGSGATGGVLKDSSFLNTLDARLAKPFLQGFSDSMDLVFLVGSAVMVVGFVVMLFLPNVELRSGSSYAQRGQDEAQARSEVEAAAAAPPATGH